MRAFQAGQPGRTVFGTFPSYFDEHLPIELLQTFVGYFLNVLEQRQRIQIDVVCPFHLLVLLYLYILAVVFSYISRMDECPVLQKVVIEAAADWEEVGWHAVLGWEKVVPVGLQQPFRGSQFVCWRGLHTPNSQNYKHS